MRPVRENSERAELLLEREGEWAVLRDALSATRGGSGGPVLLIGEAGIGKSALARSAVTAAAADGMTVLRGSGTVAGIGLFQQALGQVVPAGGSDRASSAAVTLAALADLVAEAPTVLWLVDLHAADTASIELLVPVTDWARRHRLCVIAAHRTEDGPRGPALRRLRAALRQQGPVHVLTLAPLTETGTRTLLAALPGSVSGSIAAAVHRRSDGIPFYVHELAAMVPPAEADAAEVDALLPDAVRDAVLERTVELSPGCRAALDVAVVAGPEVDAALITAVTGADRWTEDPVVRSVLVPVPDAGHRLRFRHSLVRSVVLAELSPGDRRRLHGRLAGVLVERSAPAADIAAQWLAADDVAAAGPWLVAAAAQARLAGAPREALGFTLRALRHCPPEDEDRRAELHREAALDAEAAGDWQTAADLWEQIVETAERTEDPAVAVALGRWATALEWVGRWAMAVEARQRAADHHAAQGHLVAAASERWACGAHLRSAGSFRAAVELLQVAGEEAAGGGRIDLQLRCSAHEGNARVRMGEPDGLRLVRAALDGALAGGHTEVAADIYQRLADSLEHLGDYRAAAQIYEHAVGFCETNAVAGTGSLCHACLTAVLRQTGDWDRSITVCRIVIDTPDVSRHARSVATGMWGSILALRGRTDLARPLLLESSTLARDVELLAMQILGGWGEALADRADGDLLGAAAHARRVLHLWQHSEDRHYAIAPLRWSASLLSELGDGPGARAQVAGLSRIARDTENPEIRSALLHGQAELSLLAGDAAAAADGFRRAVTVLGSAALPFERLESMRRSAAALLLLDDREGAVRDLRAAHRIARRLKAPPLIATVAADLTACDAVADPRRAGNTVALTRREEEVLRLLCAGRSNREIAAELVLSPRTVETHVANLLGKLGGRSRADAGRRAAELGLLG